jgi:hypothetical protein
MQETFAFATAIFFYLAMLPDAGLQKRANFSTLFAGLAGTGFEPGPPAWQAAALTAQPFTTTLARSKPTLI